MEHVPKFSNLVLSLILGIVISSEFCSGAVPPRMRQHNMQNPLEPITLDDFLDGKFRHRDFSGQWAPGSDNLIRIFKADSVVNYNVETGGPEELVANLTEIRSKLPADSPMSNIIFSEDEKYALIEHGRSSVWRYSALAKYDIYNFATGELKPLEPPGAESRTLQLVRWAPTGSGIAFVYNFNIYYKANADNAPVVQITHDGVDEDNAIYNGIADWVYEEEMLGGPNAMYISKTGQNLAFIKFDDRNVEEFQWPIYGNPGTNESIYPEYRKIRYPKTGSTNPLAEVYIKKLTDGSDPVKLTFPDIPEAEHHIIGGAIWTTETSLLVGTMDRVQTTLHWHLCPIENGVCVKIHTYSPEGGWVDMNIPRISQDGQKFIFVSSQKDGTQSFKHITMFTPERTSRAVTSGQLNVEGILGWDEPNNKIYFSGTFWDGRDADASQAHVYAVSDLQNTSVSCVTCGIRNTEGNECKENSVILSGGFTRFVHRCNGPDIPQTTTRLTADGSPIANPGPTEIDNKELREFMSTKDVPVVREYDVPVAGGFMAKARLYLPSDFDESKKYPLLISVYGGPGSQNIQQNYGIQWETSLVSDHKIIFGHIDGRGTAGKSTEHLYTLHNKLGTVEMEDQIAVAKHLIETESFIDANNTAIWGWSYGGYATVKVLEKDVENVFKCGISVAPVTNWLYYDTIYTERYMGLPFVQENQRSYNDSDTTSKTAIQNLRNKTLMIVHGNADDNVHYQQSMVLTRALELDDIFFHQLSYPDENHGISGPGMRKHLYHSLQRFLFDECYKTQAGGGENGERTTATATTATTTMYLTAITFIVMIYQGI